MKNYIGFINDHSGSMRGMESAAIADYNANITATKDAASKEMLDTVVSVIAVGGEYKRQVVISNPHVLKPVTTWPTDGDTPLWGGMLDMINLFQSLPDASSPDVSFLVLVTTDGQATDTVNRSLLVSRLTEMQRSGRWTFVFRVPRGMRGTVQGLGVPENNIQEWETSSAGMAASTAQTTQAMTNYYTMRSTGAKASSAFYANAKNVNTAALKEVDPKEFSLYVVPGVATDPPTLISDFVLTKRMKYLKGAAFYQLTKTEHRVQPSKLILVRDRSTGKVYAGAEARQMLGLPTTQNVRLHPGDHGNFDIFIQSESWNRHLVGGTGVIYWEKMGTEFTASELARFTKPAQAPAAPAVVQLPVVPPSFKPTPSPIGKNTVVQGPTINGRPVKFFDKRDDAREYARKNNLPKGSLGDTHNLYPPHLVMASDPRWFVYL